MDRHSRFYFFFLAIVIAIVGVILGGTVAPHYAVKPVISPEVASPKLGTTTAETPQPTKVESKVVETEESVYIKVAEAVGPSVVNVNTKSQIQFFFQAIPQEGAGSGVIITQDGYILTNNHVIEGAQQITVTLADGRTFDAKVVGRDPYTDIAVIKINATGLPAAKLGDSTNLKIGQIAIAIGNPFGLGKTVTAGIVSALNRTITTENGIIIEGLIQTDAPINPGNSGGALVNSSGEVIGINTAIYQGAQGIGFAIPIHLARSIADQIISKGYASHPWMGVYLDTVDARISTYYRLAVDYGAIIMDVVKNGPADKAGVKRGDIIVEFNGEKIETADDLVVRVMRLKVGDRVRLGIVRGDRRLTIEVTLEERPRGE
ncbi:MAG: trypsin-like peptidase domain-containing protein [bacterium]|nr:trypsin-like peptidase domain-containing protein [bacterium]